MGPGRVVSRALFQVVYERCEKLRPTLFRLAGDTVDDDDALGNGALLAQAAAQVQAGAPSCGALGCRDKAEWTLGFMVMGSGRACPKLT